uniref:Major capsid protein n=1 Tax=Panagrellus redivivus TaxID=6233 RepID=A0A7E4W8R7_PANRE
MLPAVVQQKMQNISNAANIHAVTADVTVLMNNINSRRVKNTLYKSQLMILGFLQRVVDTMYAGSTQTASGKYQLLYAVKGAPSQLKLAPSTYLTPPNPRFSSKKPVRHIITAFF